MDPAALPPATGDSPGHWWGTVTLALAGALAFVARGLVPSKTKLSPELTEHLTELRESAENHRLGITALAETAERIAHTQERLTAVQEQLAGLLDTIHRQLVLDGERAKDWREEARRDLRELRERR